MKTRDICEMALLVAIITVTGSFKLPSLFPGVEFQLSAPFAVAICAAFGFKKYIIAGCLSSLICLGLGTQNVLNVAIAMQFRLVVGFVLWLAKNRMWSLIMAGPIASLLARVFLSVFVGKAMLAMLVLALPGCIFTAVVAPILTRVLVRTRHMVRLA